MKIRFVLPETAEGGLRSAAQRLALTLFERGHDCDVVGGAAQFPHDGPVPQVVARSLPSPQSRIEDPLRLSQELASGSPDLLVIADGRPELLQLAAEVAPTLLHSHLHWAVCPDASRFWNRTTDECQVSAGWKCLALRPLLGCSGRRRVLQPGHVATQRRLATLLTTGHVGTLAISSYQAGMLLAAGVSPDNVAVIPNLGMRLGVDELVRAASQTPPSDRSTVVYLGRLSKDKGARLLPELASHLSPDMLRVFGDGYLAAELRPQLGPALRGHISQQEVAGVLQWARAVVFPSLLPEPGGIVGIDAQLFGVPLAAFQRGAALDWPEAALFPPGDAAAIGDWAQGQPPLTEPRSAEEIAVRQKFFWELVSARAERLLSEFAAKGRFTHDDTGDEKAVSKDLQAACWAGVNRESGDQEPL